jgi:uncharacterized membrane protein YczE
MNERSRDVSGIRASWHRYHRESIEKTYLPGWYATRPRRRLLVAAGAFALALLWADTVVAWNIAPSDTAVYVNLVLLAAMLGIYIPVATLLNLATRGTMALAERQLDERQVTERLRASTIAHRWTLTLIGVVAVVAGVATADEGRQSEIPGAALMLLLITLWLTHFALPLMVAGWRLADPPSEHDEPPA